MVFKNLMRRKGRTLLTVLGVSVGVAAIITLGALADGLEQGYGSVLGGSQADLILNDPDAYDLILSSVEEEVGGQLAAMPEVKEISGMLQGLVASDFTPYFFVFGYPADSFALGRFDIKEGAGLDSPEARSARGNPLLLGAAAAESGNKQVGDTIRLNDTVFRIVGIYESGSAFEDGGSVVLLEDAQTMLGMTRQVSVFYIQLKEPSLAPRLIERAARVFPEYSLNTSEDLSDRTSVADSLRAMMLGIAGIAVVIGGVGMMNAQLMAMFERTREIGVLRALGWRSRRVLAMILGESMVVGLLGGVAGVGLAYVLLFVFRDFLQLMGTTLTVRLSLFVQAFVVVLTLGIVGGLYPAWRASRLQPVEALRYEGGSAGEKATRLPFGGMAMQNLWRRQTRTLLTLGAIGITVGSIMALDSILQGSTDALTEMVGGAEIVIRQTDAPDTSVAVVDERVGDRVAGLPGVQGVSGMMLAAVANPDASFFLILGYSPNEPAIQRFKIIEGERITSNGQIMLGQKIADVLKLGVGDTLVQGGRRFRITGIYTGDAAWEELGGITTLRDAQTIAGRPRQVTFFYVDLAPGADADVMTETINGMFDGEITANLSGEFADQLPDMKASETSSNGITVMAIIVGGIAMMNTMLMSVLERTREIGVLRALGWKQRAILRLIINESAIVGVAGLVIGTIIAFMMIGALRLIPLFGEAIDASWDVSVFSKAFITAILLSLIGGILPAYRATRLQPVEALRYE